MEPRFLRAKEAAQYLSISKATLYRLVQKEALPPPTKLTEAVSVWDRRDLDHFVSMRRGDLPSDSE